MGRSAIVLAAGLGSRMKSKHHKVLHKVCGKPMITHILDELEKLNLDQIIVVVGQSRETVEAEVAGRADIAFQAEQKGTGHAVQCAAPVLKSDAANTVILYGDAPLIRASTIEQLFEERERLNAAAVVLTATVPNPQGLGRVFVDQAGQVARIVEEKDATEVERQNTLINTGIYAYRTSDLLHSIQGLRADNAQAEYYLTDTLGILRSEDKHVYSLEIEDIDEIAAVNDRLQLSEVERIMRSRINAQWMREGVTIVDPASTYIGLDVTIGQDTIIHPGTILDGRTSIGSECSIGPNARLVDAVVGDFSSVEYSVITKSSVGTETAVGPFAYVRPGSTIADRVKIGDFVEIKNSTIGDDSKVSHLAYVGDAEVGVGVNIGCGVVTVNYDGERKHKTIVGDHSFVGSNVNLIAPVVVGEGAYLVAGSTITEDVPNDGFAIARSRQVTKPNYVLSWKQGKQS